METHKILLLLRDHDKNRHRRTDEQEDEDGDGHHEPGVSIPPDGLDDPGFEDLIPPEGGNTRQMQYRHHPHGLRPAANLTAVAPSSGHSRNTLHSLGSGQSSQRFKSGH